MAIETDLTRNSELHDADAAQPHLLRIARITAPLFDVPLVQIWAIGADEYPLASAGRLSNLGANPVSTVFGRQVALQSSPLVVGDAQLDLRFAALPEVTGDPGIRFCAGQRMAETACVVCLFDERPRNFSGVELAMLRDISVIFERELLSGGSPLQAARPVVFADKSRHSLAHTLSHDFRSTLAGIVGFTELMSDASFSADQLREFAGDLHPAALRLNRMVSDLIDVGLLPDEA